jgi:hypothetical protein
MSGYDIFAWIVLVVLRAVDPWPRRAPARAPLGGRGRRRGMGQADFRFRAVAGGADLGL